MVLKQSKKALIAITIMAYTLSSCAIYTPTNTTPQFEVSNCNRQVTKLYTEKDLPKPIHTLDIDTVLTARFSFQSLNAANAIGILHDLADYVKLKNQYIKSANPELRIELIELSQKINQRINISSLEISAIASEMDCEEERASQIAAYLKAQEDNAETKLTVGAIIVGATGAITTGILLALEKSSIEPEFIGIGSGLSETALGLIILLNKRKIDFYHPRNALKDIWEGHETSEIFPAPVWYHLNYFNPNTPENPSLRYQIIERWMNYGQIADASKKQKRNLFQIYFGNGGKYTAEQLINRANMYDQLESHINLMKQNLKGLAIELENL